ncbi:unnamed protein product [Cuscuta campestris]|uniref:HAT C-terminal dimerisation domain-containing protein n=1 Tax=Cuscuta campestris TaxID=132261 RepID=A0A484NFX7_9ASTE|nr:unnamed protein product [Cuscuta campestris]
MSYIKYCYEKLLEDEKEALSKVSKIQSNLGKLLAEYESNVGTTSSPRPTSQNHTSLSTSRKRKCRYDFLADYDNEQALSESSTKTKLETYLNDPKESHITDFDILDFWKTNESRYGQLSYLARDILSVPLIPVA